MRSATAIYLFLIVTTSCSQKSGSSEKGKELSPTETVTQFLSWYRDHMDTMITIGVVRQDMKDSTDFYSVDFGESERYLSEIKSSGLVSDEYLNNWRSYFKKADEQFKVTHQNDGPPEGFDFDLIMWAQDFDLTQIESATKIEHIEGDKATVTVEFPYQYKLQYTLSKPGDSWLIDEIKNVSTP